MRRYRAIMKATALEILSEPLTLLVLIAALVLTVVMPIFHYHQFGEATRMARDAGLSALFSCGAVIAVFSTIRTFRREIETGTVEMALAHPISREGFFLAKTIGSVMAYLVIAVIIGSATVTSVIGAAIGGRIADATGDLARIWGPCVAAGIVSMIGSLFIAALLNRFARFRFVLAVIGLMVLFSVISAVVFSIGYDGTIFFRMMPPIVLLVALESFWIVVAAAWAIRFKANVAAALTFLMLGAMLPFIGNYYCADRLADGGTISWGYVALASFALVPAFIAFIILGMRLSREMK